MTLLSIKGVKILHIADMHNRHQGRLFYSTGKKLNNGFIKNNFNVLQISDRDFLQSNIFNYKKSYFLNHINNTIENFKPNIVLLGDSYTFGFGVNDGNEFAAVMSRELSSDYNIINTGVGGWGLTQQIRRYYEFA